MLTTNNEDTRDKIWGVTTVVSAVLILVLVIYFLTKMFSENPLEGTWLHEDSDLTLCIEDDETAIVEWVESTDDSAVQIRMRYSLDKELKTFSLSADETAIQEAVDSTKGNVTEEVIRSNVSVISASYEYSVENAELTLTDREYGEQMIFDKQ